MSEEQEKTMDIRFEVLSMIPAQPGLYAHYKNPAGLTRRTLVIAWGEWNIWDVSGGKAREFLRKEHGPLVYVFGAGIGPAAYVPHVPSVIEGQYEFQGVQAEEGESCWLWIAEKLPGAPKEPQ